jgi:DNA-binding MarR family transcriptional regulator
MDEDLFRADDDPRSRVPEYGLSIRQRQLLDAIRAYCEATQEACPASWLSRRFSMHHSSVQAHLSALHRKGFLATPNSPCRPRRADDR